MSSAGDRPGQPGPHAPALPRPGRWTRRWRDTPPAAAARARTRAASPLNVGQGAGELRGEPSRACPAVCSSSESGAWPRTTAARIACGPLLHHHGQLADAESPEAAGIALPGEGIDHEVADGGEHAGDQIGVAGLELRRPGVGQQQSGLGVDQEHLLDPIDQRVLEDDLGVGDAGAPGLQPPADAAW